MAERSPAKKGSQRPRVQSGPLKQRSLKRDTVNKPKERGEDSGLGADLAKEATPTRLVYSEVKGDLFDCPQHCSLGHCVSEDMAMGKGVATLFKEKFRGVGELRAQGEYKVGSGWGW